jgi:predicted RND superfamily exporter protein
MQQEIRDAVEHDRVIYNGLGFLIGIVIALIFFRHVSFMAIAIIPPAIAILWSLGALGWADFRLNLFLNVIAPLTMVMAFSDSMQMTFAMRERILAGDGKVDAIRHALLVVGPGCFLSSATAGLSFLALTFADSALIRTFGTAGVICMSVAFIAVIVLLPLVAMFLLGNTEKLAANLNRNDGPVSFLRRWSERIAVYVTSRPLAFAGAGLVFAVLLGIAHVSLEPRYRLADQVPDREQAIEASSRLDTKLTGANPVDVMVNLPDGVSVYDPQALELIAKIHRVVEQQAGVGNVWSIETLVRWLAENGQNEIDILKQYVSLLPEHLTQRFLTKEQDAAVVTGRIPDIDASDLLPTVHAMEQALAPIRAAYPDYGIYVSGLAVLAARNSSSMIQKINMMLTVEMIFVSIVIGIAFNSALIGIVSLLPGLFPVFVSGASLALTGEGLQFASIIALTVAFGLGLNATVHYLNRLRLEARLDCEPEIATARAATLIGPALIVTSIVLACGLAVTVFSDLPSLRLFGRLSATTLIAAMVAGLLLLPACMLLVKRFQARTRKKGSDSDCSHEPEAGQQLDPAE